MLFFYMAQLSGLIAMKTTTFILCVSLVLAAARNIDGIKSNENSAKKRALQPRISIAEPLTTANDFYSFTEERSQEQSYQPFSPFNNFPQTSAEQSDFNYDDPTNQNFFSPYFPNTLSFDQLNPSLRSNFPFNTDLTNYFGTFPKFNNNPTTQQVPQPPQLPQSPEQPQSPKLSQSPQLPQPPQLSTTPQQPHLSQFPQLSQFPHTSQFPQTSPFPHLPQFPHPTQFPYPPQEDLNTKLLGSGNFGVIRGGTFYPDNELPPHSADGSESNDYSSDASNSHDDDHSTKVDFVKKYTYPQEQFEHFRDFAELGSPIDGAFSQRSSTHSKVKSGKSKPSSYPKNILEQLLIIDREKNLEKKMKKTMKISQSKAKLARTKLQEKAKQTSTIAKDVESDPLMALS